MSWSERLGEVGVWLGANRVDAALAADIERLGYGTIWVGMSPPADLRAVEELLDATTDIVLATGIVNIWKEDAHDLAAAYHRIVARHPGRLLLGVGTGHREVIAERVRPLQAMTHYLDVLDAREVPKEDRVISALGPKMLAIAAERSAGTHPYLTVPHQATEMRTAMGPEALIAPEQTIVLDTDTVRSRSVARDFLSRYLPLVNYASTMRRAGFNDDDIALPGSDRLVDDIVAQGSVAELATSVRAHRSAGADHVCVQVLPAADDPRPTLAALSEEMNLA